MNNTKKLLIIGFSCTDTEDGYASYLTQKLEAIHPDLEIARCAFGGLAPPIIPGILKTILTEEAKFTHVLLEISTSIYPWLSTTTSEQAQTIIRDIISSVLDAKSQPFFLLLPRTEQHKRNLDFDEALINECIECDIHYLDLGRNMEQIFGQGWQHRHYRDMVHTNEAGGRSQAGIITPSLNAFLHRRLDRITLKNEPALTSHAIPIDSLINREASGTFVRKDHANTYVSITENETIEIAFQDETLITGVSFIMGPWSGNFTFEWTFGDRTEAKIVSAFDERSYYERLGYRAMNGNNPIKAQTVRIKYLDRAENIKLLKGDRPIGISEIRIADIFVSKHREQSDV